MRQLLGIDKVLQTILTGWTGNASKLTETVKQEQRQLYRLEHLRTSKTRNTITKAKRSSNVGSKDQTKTWKSIWGR